MGGVLVRFFVRGIIKGGKKVVDVKFVLYRVYGFVYKYGSCELRGERVLIYFFGFFRMLRFLFLIYNFCVYK